MNGVLKSGNLAGTTLAPARTQVPLVPLVILSTLVLAILPVAAPSLAQEAPRALVEVSVTPSGVSWMPTIGARGAVLTVSTPDGRVLQLTTAKGDPLWLATADDDGVTLPDGIYTWELRYPSGSRIDAETPLEQRGEGAGTAASAASGHFRIAGGAPVMTGATEPEPTNPSAQPTSPLDYVINDDLIVTGSECLGFDCVSGENFDYDTLRLKENNLQIHFDDTSVTSNFPKNDWRIVANDSVDGGASYLAFEDATAARDPLKVMAGAPNSSLYVASSGRIGLGTATPATKIHSVNGDTPTLRLDQDGSGGWPAQVWDVAGNETSFFIRDATHASALPFRIRPGAPSSCIDISAAGNVGIGTSSPTAPLTLKTRSVNADGISVVSTDGQPLLRLFETTGTGGLLSLYDSAGNEDFRISATGDSWFNSAGEVGIHCSSPDHDLTIGGSGPGCNTGVFSEIDAGESQFTVSSSRAIKTHLDPVAVPGLLDKVRSARVYTYDFVDGPADRIGLMAEDFHAIFGRGEATMLSGQEIQMALWLAVQELAARNAELEERLSRLETPAK